MDEATSPDKVIYDGTRILVHYDEPEYSIGTKHEQRVRRVLCFPGMDQHE